jgi:hypothetical protein
MTMARNLWPRPRDGESPAAPPDAVAAPARTGSAELEECLRACAIHSGKLVAGLDRKRVELAETLRQLLATHAMTPAAPPLPAPTAPAAPPVSSGGSTGLLRRGSKPAATAPAPAAAPAAPALDGAVFDALLAVGGKALECGYEDELKLALLICDTVLSLRKGSRAGWRLRGRTMEALGDEAAAVEAYERYLTMTDKDGFGIAPKIAGLRISADRQAELLRLLDRECPGASRYSEGPPTDAWAEGLALHALGDWARAEPRLVGALLAMGRDGSPAPEFQEVLGQYISLRLGVPDAGSPDPRELLGLYADQRRNRVRGPVGDPTYGGVEWITLGEFRNQIAGKSVCLIANSQNVARGSLGPEIDAYDLVVRFNSYKINAPATGERTDIHAAIHKHAFNWDQQVTTRLIFGGISNDWKHSLRTKLVAGAQRYVGDESMRWPTIDIGRLSPDIWPSLPTSGFNMLWLLDFLDVSPKLDLIGFDFYESGAYRLTEAMRLPITSVHEYTREKAWVMERAQSVTDARISLR